MKLISHRDAVIGGVERAFTRSARQTLQLAQRKAPKQRHRLEKSGKVVRLGLFRARIQFDRPYATAQEKGAFIRPKHGQKTLRFKVGARWVSAKSVRLRAQPYLRPAGKEWPRLFTEELRRESES